MICCPGVGVLEYVARGSINACLGEGGAGRLNISLTWGGGRFELCPRRKGGEGGGRVVV